MALLSHDCKSDTRILGFYIIECQKQNTIGDLCIYLYNYLKKMNY